MQLGPLALAAAAGLHLVALRDHAGDAPTLAFFAVVAVAQLAAAVLWWHRPLDDVRVLVAGGTATLLAAWALSRLGTIGSAAHPVGALDLAVVALQLVVLAAAFVPRRAPGPRLARTALASMGVVALAAAGGTALPTTAHEHDDPPVVVDRPAPVAAGHAH